MSDGIDIRECRARIGAPSRFRVRTSRGIEIGGAYIPKPPQPSADAEVIQRALLSKPARPIGERVADVIFATFLGICGAVLLVHLLSR
jgi:hypothetical protein